MSDDRVFVVNVSHLRENEDDYMDVPYSRSITYALNYAKIHHIPKSKIIAMTDEAFEVFQHNADENTGFSEIFSYRIGNKDVYIVEDEFTYLDDVVSDVCYEFKTQLKNLYHMLKYINGKKFDRLRKDIKDILKNEGEKVDLAIRMSDNIDVNKIFNRVIVKQKGEI